MLVSANLAPAAPPAGVSQYKKDQREPATMPGAEGETRDYVCRLKSDCPVGQVVILGQSIAKYQKHPDASLRENEGKMEYQMPMFQVITLAENQRDAILKRAEITPINVRPHRDFGNPDGPNVPEYNGFASEWLIIEPVNPQASFVVNMPQEEQEKASDHLSGMKAELIQKQAELGEEKRKKRK